MKSKKTRSTSAKKINQAACEGNDDFKAHELATWNRPLTALEKTLDHFYTTQEHLKLEGGKAFESNLAGLTAKLIIQFLSAVDSYDHGKIQEYAEAVRFLKNNKTSKPDIHDPERAALLKLKVMSGGQKMAIRKVAEYLALVNSTGSQTPKVGVSIDGFAALRRKCREIDFPLAASR